MPLWQTLQRAGRPFIGLVLVFVLGLILSPRDSSGMLIFLTAGNLSDVLLQQAEIGLIALAMTFVIIGAGIDLSVGSVLAASASLAGVLLVRWTPELPLAPHLGIAILGGLGIGAAVGALNGVVITRLGLQPFVMTLATMIGVRGATRWFTDNTNIDFGFGAAASSRFAAILSDKSLVITLWVVLAVIAHLVLTRTVYGRYLRAIGENERAAAYTGLPIRAVRVAAYTACGALAALAGLIHAARTHQGNPNDGVAYELDAIAAVVIGGTALAGGRGTIVGTVTGTIILGLLADTLRDHLLTLSRGSLDDPIFPAAFAMLDGKGRVQRLSNGFYGLLVKASLAPKRSKKNTGQGHSQRRKTNALGFHSLRYSATSFMKAAGVADAIVMDIIGHDSVPISQQYTKIDQKTKQRAIQTLEDVTK